MTEVGVIWAIVGLIAGIAGAVTARRFMGPRRAARQAPPPRPPASRQERRKREREADKR